MKDIKDFFSGLFDTHLWPPRWKCGQWSEFHGWLYIISDLMIWLAYFMIPIIIIDYFYRKRPNIRFHSVYILFASFILLCGTTHFLDAVMFWHPVYRFNGLVRFVTGVVSLFTVYHLIKMLPVLARSRTNLELEKEIALRMKTEKELEEANGRLSSFAYIVSHDLQEPVRKIRTYADLLQKNNKIKDEDVLLPTQKILQSATRMQTLIKDVLTLSTINDETPLTLTNSGEALRAAMETLELQIREKEAEINVGNLPVVYCNLSYLTQVFTNLMSNGMKFNQQKPVIDISGRSDNLFHYIDIADNGIGIKPEFASKLFQPFQRFNSKSSGYEGTGVGLAICKRIMEVHKGTIEMSSRPGGGTIFTLRFPKTQNSA